MASKWITKSTRHKIYCRDGYTCTYCKRAVIVADMAGMDTDAMTCYMRKHKDSMATLDHIVARVNGGDLTCTYNLVTVCNACNSSKKHTDLKVWCKRKGYNYRNIMRRIATRVKRTI